MKITPKCLSHSNRFAQVVEPLNHACLPFRGHATEASSGLSALLSSGDSSPTTANANLNASANSGNGALSHNVISFSVAIKRCSEILLYKASLCVQELNSAQEAVTAELNRLTESSEACIAVSVLKSVHGRHARAG